MLKVALVHKFNQCHVCFGGMSLSHTSSNCSWVLWSSFTRLLGCIGLRFDFPLSRTNSVLSVVWRSEISNTSGGRETGTSETDEVLGGENHLGKHFDLLVKYFRSVEVFLLVFGVLDSSVHFVLLLFFLKVEKI